MEGPRGRLAELDALRGVAVLLVLVYHYTTRFAERFDQVPMVGFPIGNYGVHVFFVISGFVIVMTLERTERPFDFLVARFSRLYPAYWTAILVTTAALWLLSFPEQPSLREIAVNTTMLQPFFRVPSVDGVYWTLAVELNFYALAFAAYCAGALPRVDRLLVAWLALSALYFSPLWAAHVAPWPFSGVAAKLLLLQYAPFFATGVAFYRLYRREGGRAWNWTIIAAAFCLSLVTQPAYPTLLLGLTCLAMAKFVRGSFALLRWAPLTFLGTISYSLYLVHQNIGHAIMLRLLQHGWSEPLRIAAATAAALLIAIAMSFLVEQPAMRAIRRKYAAFKGRGKPAGSPAATRASPAGLP